MVDTHKKFVIHGNKKKVSELLIPYLSTFSDDKRSHFCLEYVHLFDLLVLISYKKLYLLGFVCCSYLLSDLNFPFYMFLLMESIFSLLDIWVNFTFSETKL